MEGVHFQGGMLGQQEVVVVCLLFVELMNVATLYQSSTQGTLSNCAVRDSIILSFGRVMYLVQWTLTDPNSFNLSYFEKKLHSKCIISLIRNFH